MRKQKDTIEEKSITQNFGEALRATRERHARELNSIACKGAGFSREQLRKFEKIEKTAPKVIVNAMDKKLISIHKAFMLNELVQRYPEDEREANAYWLLVKDAEDRDNGVQRERVIAKKLDSIMSAAYRNFKYLNEECAEIYLRHSGKNANEAMQSIDYEIRLLEMLRHIFRLREKNVEPGTASEESGK